MLRTATIAGALASIVACGGFPTGGALAMTCSSVFDCDDGTPCTADVCNTSGLCEHTPTDGTAALVQVPYDCKQLVCERGRAVEVFDDADVRPDPCVNASCSEGTLIESPDEDGKPCVLGEGSGHCEAGMCVVACDPAAPSDPSCDDARPCTIDSCDALLAKCNHDPLDGVPAPVGNIDKDCSIILCVAGEPQELSDDSDAPTDGNECTIDFCATGVPTNEPLPLGSPCGTNGALTCDGDPIPSCVGCSLPSDCVDEDFSDCLYVLCSDPGGPMAACAALPVPDGSSCFDGFFCNGIDTCTGGMCVNHAGNPCPGADGDGDCMESCQELGAGAGDCMADDPDGSGCGANMTCSMGTCG
jgi:hypothetical protein